MPPHQPGVAARFRLTVGECAPLADEEVCCFSRDRRRQAHHAGNLSGRFNRYLPIFDADKQSQGPRLRYPVENLEESRLDRDREKPHFEPES